MVITTFLIGLFPNLVLLQATEATGIVQEVRLIH
jgi:hypothetical protein